jgi:DNA invertase Pin-like site-specific DNA recombinase
MNTKPKRAVLYLRVSTDRQTVQNQREALTAIAERRDWQIVGEYNDAGISGAKGRDQRPGLDAMLKDATRNKFDVCMAWAIDRLGRSLQDLLGTMQTLEAANVDLFIEQQALDTTTPAGKLMFQLCGAFAEFERAMIRQRIMAGLERTVAAGTKLGRKAIEESKPRQVERAKGMLADGASIRTVASATGLSIGSVHALSKAA